MRRPGKSGRIGTPIVVSDHGALEKEVKKKKSKKIENKFYFFQNFAIFDGVNFFSQAGWSQFSDSKRCFMGFLTSKT